MRKTWFIFAVILASITITLPLINCAPGAPSEDKFVTYLSLSDLTGSGAGMVVPIVEAIGFAFDDLNSKGGVKGIKVNTDSNGISGPCAYSPTDRKATAMVKLYRVQSGKLIPITDWVTTPDAVSLHKNW